MQICGICGKPLGNDVTIDHVFPQAIYKWSEEELTKQEYLRLKNRICGKSNRMKAHRVCNYDKQDELCDLGELYLDKEKQASLRYLEDHIHDAILAYKNKKQTLRKGQEGRCYWCQSVLEGEGIIRRIDPRKMRTTENACIVCADCNRTRADFLREAAVTDENIRIKTKENRK